MAYIDQVKKAKIAAALKLVIPKDWKYSLRVHNHTEITLAIMSAPIDLFSLLKNRENYGTKQYVQLNNCYIDQAFDDVKVTDIMLKARDALNIDNFDHSDSMSDYYHVGHYVSMHLGKWDKPFAVK